MVADTVVAAIMPLRNKKHEQWSQKSGVPGTKGRSKRRVWGLHRMHVSKRHTEILCMRGDRKSSTKMCHNTTRTLHEECAGGVPRCCA